MAYQTQSMAKYAYDHVHSKVLMEDMAFTDSAPRPGNRLPDFELPTPTGETISSAELRNEKPLLLIIGSLTCPMTKSSAPLMKQLHQEFGSRISFVLLHVREAHPGEHRDQPHSESKKLEHATRLQERDQFAFPIAVDSPEGTIHRQLDGKPNSIWLADQDGSILYRGLWAGDEKGLRQALEAAAEGRKPEESESNRRLVPMAMGIGVMQESIREAGSRAQRDLIKSAPPMAAMAWIADQFRSLSPKGRGFAAMGTLGVGIIGLAAVAVRTIRR